MLYRISVAERGLTGIANIFRSRLSRLDDLLRAGTVPLMISVASSKVLGPKSNMEVVFISQLSSPSFFSSIIQGFSLELSILKLL